MNNADILQRLDFNALHSGDAVARAYFEHAALAIRRAEQEAKYWEHQFIAERGRRLEAERDADTIGTVLTRIVEDAQGTSAREG